MSDLPVPANERLVNQGGLMRCCLATISLSTEPTTVGSVLDCKYEAPGNQKMVVGERGEWRWNRP